jgi:hypothetical protein
MLRRPSRETVPRCRLLWPHDLLRSTGDASPLAAAICEILSLPDQQEEILRTNGGERGRDFNCNITAYQTINELRKVMR